MAELYVEQIIRLAKREAYGPLLTYIFWEPSTQNCTCCTMEQKTYRFSEYPERFIGPLLHIPWANNSWALRKELKESVQLSETTVLDGLELILERYPGVAAWVNLFTLRVAVMLNWPRVVEKLVHILEHRQLWFGKGGKCAEWAETNDVPREIPFMYPAPREAILGESLQPHVLRCQDTQASTMNIDHAIEEWDAPIELCARVLACNVGHWETEVFESNFRVEQMRQLRYVFENGTYTSDSPGLPRTRYETIIAKARDLRRTRLRGVLWCFVRLHTILTKHRFYSPGGKYYLEAKKRFEMAIKQNG